MGSTDGAGDVANPWETENQTRGPQPFATSYVKSKGEPLVYGGLVMAVFFIVASVASGAPEYAASALVPLAVAFWFYPMIDTRHPQLGANGDGLFVERIGFINWASISSFGIFETSVRNIALRRLQVTLNCPLAEAVAKPQKVPFWKMAMSRNWSRHTLENGAERIDIELHPLRGTPEDILNRVRAYRNV